MRKMRKSGQCSITKLLTARWAGIVALLCWVGSYSPPSAYKVGGLAAELHQGRNYPLFFAMAQEDDGITSSSSSSSSSSSPSAATGWDSDADADGGTGISSSSSSSSPSSNEDDDVFDASLAGPSQSSPPPISLGDEDDSEPSEDAPISSSRMKIPPVSLPSAFHPNSSFPLAPLLSASSPPVGSAPSSSDESDLLPQGPNRSASPPAVPRPSTSTPVAYCGNFVTYPAGEGIRFDAAAELHVITFDDLTEIEMHNFTYFINGTTYISLNGTAGPVGARMALGPGGWGVQATFRKGFCSVDGSPGESYRFQGRHGVENALQMHGVVGTGGEISLSADRPFVVTFDDAKSVTVKLRQTDDWEVVACCNLIPRFPTIPDEWTVTIESNLVKQRNTVYKTEFFSGPRQKLRIDQEINRMRVITFVDLDTREIKQVLPNSTCISLNVSEIQYSGIEYGFLGPASTLDFFRALVSLDRFEYVPSKQNVRGVDVEEWRGQYQEPGATVTYNISMYFAADTWEVNDDMFHRDLKRIRVSNAAANDDDPEGVEQYHEFFQMRPVIASNEDTVFDPCSVSSQVTGCGCGQGSTVADGSRSTPARNGMNLNSEANGRNAVANGENSVSSNNCHFGLSTGKVVGIAVGLVAATAVIVSIGWYAYIKSRPDAWAFRFSQKERSFWRR